MGEVGLGGFCGVLADLCGISTMLAMRLDEGGWEDKMRDNAKGVSETREEYDPDERKRKLRLGAL